MIIDANVDQAYRSDQYLQYVNIVDFGSDSSTTEYNFVSDSDSTWVRIPTEVYYWYVIMPKLVMERPKMGASVFNRFWRDYLWNVAVTDTSPGNNLHLGNVLTMASVFWDGESIVVDTHSDFNAEDCVLVTIWKWVAKTVPFGSPPPNRPNQPNKIANNHQGTCSELRMLLVASGRTGLIPLIGTWDYNENHHWNEFWWDGAWHPYQVNLGYGDCLIDLPGVAQDMKYGGGKNISIVWNERADGYQESVIDIFSDL
ncbi:MAG: transglutaminase domain-containing protein, partial [bacterium]